MCNVLGTLVLRVCLIGSAAITDRQLYDEKNWGDTRTWPRFAVTKPVEAGKEDTSLTKLLKMRHNAVLKEFAARYNYWQQNAATLNEVYDAAQRFSQARLELTPSVNDRINLLKDKLDFFRYVEGQVHVMDKKQKTTKTVVELDYVSYCRLNSEIELTREEMKSVQTGQDK